MAYDPRLYTVIRDKVTDNNEVKLFPTDGHPLGGRWAASIEFYSAATDLEMDAIMDEDGPHAHHLDTIGGISNMHITVTSFCPTQALAKLWAVCEHYSYWAFNA